MADGDIYLITSEFELTPAGERVYELLEPLTRSDDEGLLRVLADVLAVGIDPIWSFCEWPGAAAWLTPEDAPAEWLPWLARIVGARFTASMLEAQRRLELAHPSGYERGRAEVIRAIVDAFLTGARTLIIREEPYELTIRTRLAETTDPALVRVELLRNKPAAHTLDYLASNERDWAEIESTWATWADVAVANVDWDDVNIAIT